MTSALVKTDSLGVASATFKAIPDTIGHVDVMAASPLTSGQVRFKVEIKVGRRRRYAKLRARISA